MINPSGGFYFVFLAGVPQFRKYDAAGQLLFERHIEGAELDRFVQALPTTWPRRKTDDGEMPIVPAVGARGGRRCGRQPVDLDRTCRHLRLRPRGDKTAHRAVPRRRDRLPDGLSFTPKGRLLVAPGCYAFDVVAATEPSHAAMKGAAPARKRAAFGSTR